MGASRSSIRRFTWLGALLVGGVVTAVLILMVRSDANSNYLVIDSESRGAAVRIDGKPAWSAKADATTGEVRRKTMVLNLSPGHHLLEAVDPQGTVIDRAELDVQGEGYRAVYSVDRARRYAVVSVGYGKHVEEPTVALASTSNPRLSVLESGRPVMFKRDLESVNDRFPKTVRSKGGAIVRRLCTLNSADEPECGFGT